MNSAAELRRFTDNQALDKAVKAVTEALIAEPLGLEISQIMNNCRLSNKTTKTVLRMINATNNNGVWSLGGQIQPKVETVLPQPVTTEIKKVEAMPAPTTATQDQDKKVPYLKRLIELLRENPKGISLENALKILGGQRGRFDQELIRVRRYQFPVRLENGLYIPDLNKKPSIKPLPLTPAVKKSEPEPTTVQETADQKLPTLKPAIPVNQDVQDKVIEFRAMVQKRVVVTEEVTLNSEQLDTVLKDIFGLDTVTWTTEGGKVQVHLTKTEVA